VIKDKDVIADRELTPPDDPSTTGSDRPPACGTISCEEHMAEEAEDLDLEHEGGTDDACGRGGGRTRNQAAFDPEAVARLAGWAP
jgi:hypothetical protein